MRRNQVVFLLSGILLVAAVLVKFWVAPLSEMLPADYSQEFLFNAESRFRDTPDGVWQDEQTVARRMDQTLTSTGNVCILQSDIRWVSSTGKIIFVGSGIYGVDRQNKTNLTGYGDRSRSGQFLFPTHLQPVTFNYWDTNFAGKLTASYSHEETIEGIQLLVFDFAGVYMDETDGYSFLPQVPEKYLTYTDGQGKLWIEPVSGTLVEYEENGVSYFVNRLSKEKVDNFFEWSAHFTPETRTTQSAQARAAMQRILILDTWLPAVLLLAGMAGLGLGFWSLRHPIGSPKGGQA